MPIKEDFIENIILTEEKKLLYRKIEQLGSPLTELVKLRIIMNFSFQEIGGILKYHIDTTKITPKNFMTEIYNIIKKGDC